MLCHRICRFLVHYVVERRSADLCLGSITSRCSGEELLPEVTPSLGEGPDQTRESGGNRAYSHCCLSSAKKCNDHIHSFHSTFQNTNPCIINNQVKTSMCMLWFKFSFGAKFLKLVQFLFSFVMYSLP